MGLSGEREDFLVDVVEGIFDGRQLEFEVEFVGVRVSGVALVEDGGLELCVLELVEIDGVEHEAVFD